LPIAAATGLILLGSVNAIVLLADVGDPFAGFMWGYSTPDEGFVNFTTPTEWPAMDSVRWLDTFVAVDGIPVGDVREPFASKSPGDEVTYTFRGGSGLVEKRIRVERFTIGRWFASTGLLWAVGVVYSILGVLATGMSVRARPGINEAVGWALIFMGSIALTLIGNTVSHHWIVNDIIPAITAPLVGAMLIKGAVEMWSPEGLWRGRAAFLEKMALTVAVTIGVGGAIGRLAGADAPTTATLYGLIPGLLVLAAAALTGAALLGVWRYLRGFRDEAGSLRFLASFPILLATVVIGLGSIMMFMITGRMLLPSGVALTFAGLLPVVLVYSLHAGNKAAEALQHERKAMGLEAQAKVQNIRVLIAESSLRRNVHGAPELIAEVKNKLKTQLDQREVDKLKASLHSAIDHVRDRPLREIKRILEDFGPEDYLAGFPNEESIEDVARTVAEACFTVRPTTTTEIAPESTNWPLEVKTLLHDDLWEMIDNAVRHGLARSLTIEFKEEEGRWAVMCVEDNGRGFDVNTLSESELGTHWGLRWSMARAQRMGGEIRVVSSPGNGAKVTERLPIPPAAGA